VGNGAAILKTEDKPWMERPYSIAITLPPLAGIILKLVAENAEPEKIEQQKLTKKVASKKVAKTKEVASQKSADDNLAIA